MEYIKKALEADKSFARVEALDVIAKKFAGADDKAAVIAEAKVWTETPMPLILLSSTLNFPIRLFLGCYGISGLQMGAVCE